MLHIVLCVQNERRSPEQDRYNIGQTDLYCYRYLSGWLGIFKRVHNGRVTIESHQKYKTHVYHWNNLVKKSRHIAMESVIHPKRSKYRVRHHKNHWPTTIKHVRTSHGEYVGIR